MAEHLPLLVFPQARTIPPPRGRGFPPSQPHLPAHERQIERLTGQLADLEQDFARYKASVSSAVAGLEPETVLVIEIAGRVEDFKRAVDHTDGLEWLGEWDIEDIEPDEDFFEENNQGEGERTDKPLQGRLFLSLSNETGLIALLNLWKLWERGETLPPGKTKWRDVFAHTRKIRRWGTKETLRETGMIGLWRDMLDPITPDQKICFQIELFYRQSREKRQQSENAVVELLKEIDGETLGPFIDMSDIAFHAVKAKVPCDQIRTLVNQMDSSPTEIDIRLFKFPGVMYFRPTGQSVAAFEDEAGVAEEFPEGAPELPPVVAILDGVPNIQHDALKDRLLFDDPDNLAATYQPGERKHGTTMASLVIHGEQPNRQSIPLAKQVYHRPVMQSDVTARGFGRSEEHFPDDVFPEDRIERAVRRMFAGEGNTEPQAPGVKIINLSLGDRERPFIHTPSPWAKLLDWLSWKYRVLFCVSAGNFLEDIDIGVSNVGFAALPDEEKVAQTLKRIAQQLSKRRLLSPAESLNALTVGALHTDESGADIPGQRTDLLPNSSLFSPISRFGHGFRRSVKPEILFPGGRQLYKTPPLDGDQKFMLAQGRDRPGQ